MKERNCDILIVGGGTDAMPQTAANGAGSRQ